MFGTANRYCSPIMIMANRWRYQMLQKNITLRPEQNGQRFADDISKYSLELE